MRITVVASVIRIGHKELNLWLVDGHRMKSMARYSVLALCNKCGGLHELNMSVELKDGPIKKQSIADTYRGEPLPQSLASLSGSIVTCPTTGRQSTQKNNHQMFLVPKN